MTFPFRASSRAGYTTAIIYCHYHTLANSSQGPNPLRAAHRAARVPKNIKHTKIQWTSQLTLHCLVPTRLAARSGNKGARQRECAGAGCVPTAPNIWQLGSNIKADFWSLSVWDEDGYPVCLLVKILGRLFSIVMGRENLLWTEKHSVLAWCTYHSLTLLLH